MTNADYFLTERLITLRDRTSDTNDNERRTDQSLRVELTQEEIITYAKEAADSQSTKRQLEADLAHLKKSMQGRIDAQQAVIDTNSERVRNGYDLRTVECVDVLDHPKRGKKTTFRLDTLEAVAEGLMTDGERQRMMRLEETQEAKVTKEAESAK